MNVSRAKLWRLVLLGVALLAAVVAVGSAVQWWSDQRLRTADLEQLLEVTRNEPRNGLAHYYLGVQLAEQGRATAATEAFRQAVTLFPRTRARMRPCWFR